MAILLKHKESVWQHLTMVGGYLFRASNTSGKMKHCTSRGFQCFQSILYNSSERQTSYPYVTPLQNCQSFVPAELLEQGTNQYFSYDKWHSVEHTEMKVRWM